jgi:hypothetical protein
MVAEVLPHHKKAVAEMVPDLGHHQYFRKTELQILVVVAVVLWLKQAQYISRQMVALAAAV